MQKKQNPQKTQPAQIYLLTLTSRTTQQIQHIKSSRTTHAKPRDNMYIIISRVTSRIIHAKRHILDLPALLFLPPTPPPLTITTITTTAY